MKALLKTGLGKENVELREVPIPTPVKGEALIRVKVAGLCGTDVHICNDAFANTPPVILGHEFSGVVEQVGPDVGVVKPGERVVAENNPYACKTCEVCASGSPNLCPQKRAFGIHSDGAFADYIKLPAHLLHTVPSNVSFEEAAVAEPIAVSAHSVIHRCGVTRGDTVVVFGPGPIGLMAAQVARAEGAETVLLVGTNKDEEVRFKCAKELQIQTLNAEKKDIRGTVLDLTHGIGADVVVEASGSGRAIATGMDLLKRAGRMAVTGLTGASEVPVNWDQGVVKELTVFFAYGALGSDWRKALQLLSDSKVNVSPLITHHFSLEQWQDALNALETLQAVKALFMIGDTEHVDCM